ncbi:hypothetical protein HID58_056016 [Brassica napus]|uniref:VOC domain-containing protein n=2 Tax=Brassica napus TaxID=3708 RepID=A0ABQ8AMW5_BRANA|nr:hypothetical protein HID58_056016 [Brassica napus]CDY71590.1 BnaUnng04460D [Brassica napus]
MKCSLFCFLFDTGNMASFSWKNLKYHLLMDPDGVAAASTFYNTVFGAVLKKSFTLAQVELKLARNFLVISKGNIDPNCGSQTQIQLAVDVKAVMDAAITRGALNQTELITESEASRGIVAKLRDPFGYNWAFSHRSNQSDDICSLCFMDAPHHTSINFCTLPHTRRWLIAASHTPPNVTEEDMANKLFKIYFTIVDILKHPYNRTSYFEEYYGFQSFQTYIGHASNYLFWFVYF